MPATQRDSQIGVGGARVVISSPSASLRRQAKIERRLAGVAPKATDRPYPLVQALCWQVEQTIDRNNKEA